MNIKINIIGSGCTCDIVEDMNAIKSLLESPTIQNAKDTQTITIKGAVLFTVIKVLPDDKDIDYTPSS